MATTPPPVGHGDLNQVLRQRREPRAEPRRDAETPAPARRTTAAGPMDRRSWYMPKATADDLADVLEDLHYATRVPKHVILAALVDVALSHLDEVRDIIDASKR